MPKFDEKKLTKKDLFLLGILLIDSFLLRTLFLGHTFQSADNVALADRIIHHRGYAWMVREYYGFLINFVVKIFAATISSFGIRLNEFWWKLPIALFGTAQGLLTFFFLKRWFKSVRVGLMGLAFLTILPVHVMQSRYLWGYEILGIFFLTIFIWQWLNFLENPTFGSGRRASIALAFYLISHGYIFPFFPAFFISWFVVPPVLARLKQKETEIDSVLASEAKITSKFEINNSCEKKSDSGDIENSSKLGLFKVEERAVFRTIWSNFRTNLNHFYRFRVWLYPLLFSPLTIGAWRHTGQKQLELGFYLSFFCHFIENTGLFLFIFICLAPLFFILKHSDLLSSHEHSPMLLFLIFAISYLAPFLVVLPQATVVRGYMNMGIYWLLLFALVVWDRVMARYERNAKPMNNFVKKESPYEEKANIHVDGQWTLKEAPQKIKIKTKSRWALAVMIFLFLTTSWGTIESIFFRDQLFDPSLVKSGRGNVFPDPGTKAAGYLFFKYFPETIYPAASYPILVLHRNIEPPCVSYYWRRQAIAFYDYDLKKTKEAFFQYKDQVALVVADPEQVVFISQEPAFEPRIILYYRGQPRLYIFCRSKTLLPLIKAGVKEYNSAFDRELAPKVSLLN